MKSIRYFLIRAKRKGINFSFDPPESIFGIEKRTFLEVWFVWFYFCFKKLFKSYELPKKLPYKKRADVFKKIFCWTSSSIKIAWRFKSSIPELSLLFTKDRFLKDIQSLIPFERFRNVSTNLLTGWSIDILER